LDGHEAMSKKRESARDVAKRRGDNAYWVNHAEIVEQDYEWLESAEKLTVWNVRIPAGFLARLSKLWWLDIRGGSATNLAVAKGAARLQYLGVNQIRGMRDLSVLSELTSLRYLDMYGLPQVTRFPSLSALVELEHARVGQLRGLLSMDGLLDAPHLRELEIIRRINVTDDDVKRIINHPALKQFGWFAEDVPAKVCVPVVEKINLPNLSHEFPADWFAARHNLEAGKKR
jgi:hypothetical protein